MQTSSYQQAAEAALSRRPVRTGTVMDEEPPATA